MTAQPVELESVACHIGGMSCATVASAAEPLTPQYSPIEIAIRLGLDRNGGTALR